MDYELTNAAHLSKDEISYFALNSYVLEPEKLHYVSTPKVACTALKWWIAELAGTDLHGCDTRRSWETEPDLVIHDLLPELCPNIVGFPSERMHGILASNDYFRFAVVRNPYKRIFSAWQSKLLLREPFQITPYLNKEFFSTPVEQLGDVATAFEAFLEYVAEHEWPHIENPHWAPQVEVLRLNKVHYSHVAQIENSESLWSAIAAHISPKPLMAPLKRHSNESLIPYQTEFFSKRSKELIQKLYAEDFDTFLYPETLPLENEPFSNAEMTIAIKAIKTIRGKNSRFGQIRRLLDEMDNLVLHQTRAANGKDFELNQKEQTFAKENSSLQQALKELELARQEQANRVSEAQVIIDNYATKTASQREKLDALKAEKLSSESRALSLSTRIDGLEAENTLLRDNNINLQLEKSKLDAALDTITRSISWRLTKPLRSIRERYIKRWKNV